MKTTQQKSVDTPIQKQVDDVLVRMLSTPPQAQKPKKKTQKSDK